MAGAPPHIVGCRVCFGFKISRVLFSSGPSLEVTLPHRSLRSCIPSCLFAPLCLAVPQVACDFTHHHGRRGGTSLNPAFHGLSISSSISTALTLPCLPNHTNRLSLQHNQDFETADAGASKIEPRQCSALRKNDVIVSKGRPAKIVDMSTSKTGKHGHAKVHIVAIDIFTDKKYEELSVLLPASVSQGGRGKESHWR